MDTEKVVDHIVNWLKDYAVSASMDGFVIGISGGIDSAVTSMLCARTGLRTLCLEMPIHQTATQVTRAQNHIEFLKQHYANISNLQVDLTSVFEQFKMVVPQVDESATHDLSLANTRARLRMSTLYYFAGLHKYLVAGTGNKIEDFGVGFFTKYGDGGVDLSPIADLTKSEIYEIAKYLNINKEIIVAAPTDGLFGDDRSDEDQLGASYEELEWAMKHDTPDVELNEFSSRQKEVFEIYRRLNRMNQHKMNPIPTCKIPVHLKN